MRIRCALDATIRLPSATQPTAHRCTIMHHCYVGRIYIYAILHAPARPRVHPVIHSCTVFDAFAYDVTHACICIHVKITHRENQQIR